MAVNSSDAKSPFRSRRFTNRGRTGCQTCRVRKMKCDERKPLCGPCERAGYECRGLEYANGMGRAVLRKIERQSLSTASSPMSIIPFPPGYAPQLHASNDVRDILYLGKTARVKEAAGFGSLAANTRVQSISLRTCMEFLPSMVGHDLALDSAVACVANALRCCHLSPVSERDSPQDSSQGSSPIGSSSNDSQTTLYRSNSLALYACALKDLQEGLNDQQRSVGPELLLATILLMYFEAIFGHNETGIIAHADGAARLIQHRGPHRFSSVLEKRILTSQYPLIVTSALFLNKAVFMNTSEWIAALKSSLAYSPAAEADEHMAMEYMISSMTSLDLLAATTALATDKQISPYKRNKQRLALLERLAKAQQDYDRWRRHLERDIRKSESAFTLFPEDSPLPSNGYSDSDARINVWFWTEAGGFILMRLHVALGGKDSQAVELKAQTSASYGMQFYKENSGSVQQQATLIFLMLTNAVLATAQEWADFSVDGEGKLAETGMLFRWLAFMGVQSRRENNE